MEVLAPVGTEDCWSQHRQGQPGDDIARLGDELSEKGYFEVPANQYKQLANHVTFLGVIAQIILPPDLVFHVKCKFQWQIF